MEFYMFLLLVLGGLGLVTVLISIKLRRQHTESTTANASVLDHDLTTGRFGPFWSFVVAVGKIVGIGMFLLLVYTRLSDLFGNHDLGYAKQLNDRMSKLGVQSSDKPHPLNTPMSDDLDKQLAARAQEVRNHSSSANPAPSLRRHRSDFVSRYGAPSFSEQSTIPPASVDECFDMGDFVLYVAFWNDVAHQINVFRKDKTRLTPENVETLLAMFSGAEKWVNAALTVDHAVAEWQRPGAWAVLVEYRAALPDGNENDAVDMLRIATEEFLSVHTKLEKH